MTRCRSCAAAFLSSARTMGISKRCLNFAWLPRYPGIRKSKMDQSSVSVFSIGVPVSAKQLSDGRRLTARALCVAGFLMCWASSRKT